LLQSPAMGVADDPGSAAAADASADEDGARERDDRSAILRRRAVFVASAIAGLTFPACTDPRPQPCLDISIPTPPSAGASASAEVDAGVDPATDAGVDDAAVPRPCLSEAPDHQSSGSAPRPCLKGILPTPRPCLDMPPPQVCLEMAPPPPSAPPRPCLNR
jgi:hypothetical protein